MRCEICNSWNDMVKETRHAMGGRTTRRRRVCLSCGSRFTTYEIRKSEYINRFVVK